jgi:hypothetical protein
MIKKIQIHNPNYLNLAVHKENPLLKIDRVHF